MRDNLIRKIVFGLGEKLLPRLSMGEANNLIYKSLMDDQPLMLGRLGAVEVKCILYGMFPFKYSLFLRRYVKKHAHNNAGFFPMDRESFRRFKDLMLADMRELDILATWRPEELLFKKQLRRSRKIPRDILFVYDHPMYWSRALEGKKVLVVHPFVETIEKQYKERRELLFKNEKVLPEFASFQVIKAVQTAAGNTAGFDSWFDALEYMKAEIAKCDFDVCLLACGAYGIPLAAHIKRMGKKAVHMGGSMQLLFGVIGKRWERYPMRNKYWVRPSASERPKGFNLIEDGCYW